MASIFSFSNVGEGIGEMDVGYSPGVGFFLVDAGIGYGGGRLLGYVVTKHRKTWLGKNSPRLLAAVGKLSAAFLAIFTGSSFLTSAINSAGQVGLTAMGMQRGIKDALKAEGLRVAALPEKQALPAGAEEIGRLPEADPDGSTLSWDNLENFARAA
jgi:hypothetical protein